MNLVEKFKALISLFRQNKQPPAEQIVSQSGEEETQSSNSKKSVLEPALPKIYGLKKNLLTFILLAVAVVFILAILFGYFSGRGTQTKIVSPDIRAATEIQDPSKAIPSNYEALAKYSEQNKQTAQQDIPPKNEELVEPIPPQNQDTSDYGAMPIPQIPQNYISSALPIITQEIDSEINKKRGESIRFFSNAPAASTTQNSNLVENESAQNVNVNYESEAKKKLTSGESQKPNYNKLNQFQLTTGTIIPVTLLTGLNSDIPGQVISQVRQNVYDSQTGNYLLIPQGARLVGEYGNTNIKNGQNRIDVNWNRLILPNGFSVNLDNMPGVDIEGYTGLHDKVNNHTSKIMRAAFFTSILAAGAMYAAGNQTSDTQTPGQAAVSGAAANMMASGQKIMDKNLDMSPTIIVRPGTIFSVYVNRDLVLKPY